MNVLLIGGTGLVGSYLLPKLTEKKHNVFALTRSNNKIEKINNLGAVAILGDIRNPETFINNLPSKPDIIVLLAMPSVKPGKRLNKTKKAELRNETNDFFQNSINLALKFDIPIILPGGTSFQTENNEFADETWTIYRKGITEIGMDTDKMVENAFRNNSPKAIQLIFGKIYGNGGLFRFMYNMMKKGKGMIIGEGDNCIPNIHASDAANAVVKAIEKLPFGEKFIIADDTSVTQKDFNTYMAELMGISKIGHIPGFIFRIVLGKDFYEVVKMNCKVSNAKAKKNLEWKPEFPSYKEGLKSVITEMNQNKNYFEE